MQIIYFMVDHNDQKKKKFPKMNPAVLSLTSLEMEKKLTVKKEQRLQERAKMSPDFHTKKGKGKTDNLSKQNALIQISSLRQQIPCETLRLICGEVGTNAHSTLSMEHTQKSSSLSVHKCKFILLLSHLMTNAYCHCH